MKKVSIFGATGSIGNNATKIIYNNISKYKVIVLSANKNYKRLALNARLLKSKYAVIKDKKYYNLLKNELSGSKIKCLSGEDELIGLAGIKTDYTIASIVGIAGLKPAYNSIGNTKNLALANKEALICAGKIFISKARKLKTNILPLDSEHNALFQIIENNRKVYIKNIILTASGGPFWNKKLDLNKVTVKQALMHPNWKMGKKISVDSATMMNKVLEKIEAAILFSLDLDKIDIVVHPKSIVHGVVNFIDGNSLMLMSKPDMKIPINCALNWPKRLNVNIDCINLKKIKKLEFFDVTKKDFSSLEFFKYLYDKKINYCRLIALNASNEIAVESFLNKKIGFLDITKVIKNTVLTFGKNIPSNIQDVFEIHQEASRIASNFVNKLNS
ncbi:MAG: 1-deoxy-D-xylulose 5-phosphate reductoisomerase [Alphaproteobacteria bacterium MarineAlpha9_Bin4]|nr:MAG: 1-deoxy-D-xylulose 5-phosphate reductoisomerase [Alphaproteobacteria bacterium MarineAlpha9_Bin4]